MVRVVLPFHLSTLARTSREIQLSVIGNVTLRTVLDALEAAYPVLNGTVREHVTQQRRPLMRFFACEEDWSFDSHDKPLPEKVADGQEPLFIVGAIAGG